MTFLDPVLDAAFEDIFGGQKNNRTRLNRYDEKVGPWQMTYRYNGELGLTCGKTREECRQATLIKTGGDDYEELEMEIVK